MEFLNSFESQLISIELIVLDFGARPEFNEWKRHALRSTNRQPSTDYQDLGPMQTFDWTVITEESRT